MSKRSLLLTALLLFTTASPSWADGLLTCARVPAQLTASADVQPAGSNVTGQGAVSLSVPPVPFEIEQVSLVTSTSVDLGNEFPPPPYSVIYGLQLVTRLNGSSAAHLIFPSSVTPFPGQDAGHSTRVTLYADASSPVTLKFSTHGINPFKATLTRVGRFVTPGCWIGR